MATARSMPLPISASSAIMNYKVIGHLLQAADQRVACMSPRGVSSAIVAIDIICVILQFGGSVCATISIALRSTLITSISTNVLLISFGTDETCVCGTGVDAHRSSISAAMQSCNSFLMLHLRLLSLGCSRSQRFRRGHLPCPT
jgi:hypothetical protein